MAIARNISMESALNVVISISSSALFVSPILKDVSPIVEKIALNVKLITSSKMVSASPGKNKVLACWVAMIAMISISLPLMSGNPSITSTTSHLPQKSENSSSAHTSITHTKTARSQLLRESQAKDGRPKLQTKINSSASKSQMHLLHSMPFKSKLLKETTLPNFTLSTQSMEKNSLQSKMHSKFPQLLRRIWLPFTLLESMPLLLELGSVASKDGQLPG